MSSRKLASPPPNLSKTEDRKESENYDGPDQTGTLQENFTRSRTTAEKSEKDEDDAKLEAPPQALIDDGEGGQTSELASEDQQVLVTDVVTLADCLPKVWKDIFDTLDSEDMLTCFRTSSKWRNWLGHKRTLLLFPEVASLLFPPNDPSLLECRKVCTSWNEDVDSQVHRSLILLPFEKGAASLSCTIAIETIEKIRQILGEATLHAENPFPWRSIKIGWNSIAQFEFGGHFSDERNDYLSEFRTNLIQFLDALGHQIYYVEFDLHFYEWRLGSPDLIRDFLLRLPNLRKLELCINWEGEYVVEPEPLTTYYAANPLPQLVHLETVKVGGVDVDAVPVLCSCIAPQSIKRLDIAKFYEAMQDFNNLGTFRGWILLEDLERFQNAAQKPPLKNLDVRVELGYEHEIRGDEDFQGVFTCLAEFSESLEYLRLDGFGPIVLIDEDFRINLPKLKTLRLKLFDGCLDTLVELSALTDLDVQFARSEMWNRETVTVLGVQKQIRESNIWELLPFLENLIVRDMNDWDFEPTKYKRNLSNGFVVEVQGYNFHSDADESEDGS